MGAVREVIKGEVQVDVVVLVPLEKPCPLPLAFHFAGKTMSCKKGALNFRASKSATSTQGLPRLPQQLGGTSSFKTVHLESLGDVSNAFYTSVQRPCLAEIEERAASDCWLS